MYGKEKLRYEKEMSSYVGASSNNYISPEDSQRSQNISIMTIGDVNINNVTNNVNEHSIGYDDQGSLLTQKDLIGQCDMLLTYLPLPLLFLL